LTRPEADITWAATIDEPTDTAKLALREALTCWFDSPQEFGEGVAEKLVTRVPQEVPKSPPSRQRRTGAAVPGCGTSKSGADGGADRMQQFDSSQDFS